MPDGGGHQVSNNHHLLENHAETVPHLTRKRLAHSQIRLQEYQGNSIPILRSRTFQVQSKKFSGPLQIIVMDGSLPSFLGLDWFASLGLGITGVNAIHEQTTKELLGEFAKVFDEKLGRYKGTPHCF